ncbi:hypothetical protein [Fluviispira sanaruensis]|uniref:Uncharacterized protein n=1 Tax=Fluviispira sanaruensis TaxID=2493639 RepID=A0A4P2VWI3_FLUSA|nr:hypothetical protein [Fluviispira sanaruensis]BBH53312.1 hypothetical protein JCM31447_17550 [Fluviispira sanaruensis]
MKNLQQTTKIKWQENKNKYRIVTLTYVFMTVFVCWYVQIYLNDILMKQNYILTIFLLISWFPFLLGFFIYLFLKIPIKNYLFIPNFSKKIIWAFLIPSIVASIAIYISQYLLTINIDEPTLALHMEGDHIASALFLLFSAWMPAVFYCIVVSFGFEISLRGFFIEIAKRASLPFPWLLAGLLQFIILLPFLWFGYLGGGLQNIRYVFCWLVLLISLSAFNFWLSLPDRKSDAMLKNGLQLNNANRNLVPVLLAASIQNIVYYVVASRFVIESGHWWMSGPANVIAVVLYFLITIFLLTTKRLKYEYVWIS